MKKLLLGFAYMLAVAQNVGAQEASNFARLYVGVLAWLVLTPEEPQKVKKYEKK